MQAGIPARFTDNGDGTITDHVTGLMWEKLGENSNEFENPVLGSGDPALRLHRDAGGPITWRLGGYADWRLPNRRELESLVDLGRHDPAIDPIFNHYGGLYPGPVFLHDLGFVLDVVAYGRWQ